LFQQHSGISGTNILDNISKAGETIIYFKYNTFQSTRFLGVLACASNISTQSHC